MPRQNEAQDIDLIFSAEEISDRISQLAAEIASMELEDLLVVAILKGSFIFASDLIRALYHEGISPEVDFLSLASYKEKTISSGHVEITRDLETDVTGRNILIVDDILESGRTLAFANKLMTERGAKRLVTCVLLNKKVERAIPVEADFHAFQCPDVFVVGYGMDLAHRYRELPFVGQIK